MTSGQRYPCKYGNATTQSEYETEFTKDELLCLYEHGEVDANSPFSVPHKVLVTNYQYKILVNQKIQFLIKNPKAPMTVRLYAMGVNPQLQPNPPKNDTFELENQLLGWSSIDKLFSVQGSEASQYTEGFLITPSHPPSLYTQINSGYSFTLKLPNQPYDFTLIKFPLRIEYEELPEYYLDLCLINQTRNQYFIFDSGNLHDVYGYKLFFSNETLSLHSIQCTQYMDEYTLK